MIALILVRKVFGRILERSLPRILPPNFPVSHCSVTGTTQRVPADQPSNSANSEISNKGTV